MTNMSTGSQAITRSRPARIVGVLLAAVFLLAGCSSGGADSAAGYGMNESQADWAGASDGGGDMAERAIAEEAGEDGSSPTSFADSNRDVIITGELYVTVENPTAAATSAETIVRDAGGRIDGRHETAADDYGGGSAWLTLRIPAK